MPLPALRNTFFSRSAVVCGACTMQRHAWAHQKTKPPTSWRCEAATPLVVKQPQTPCETWTWVQGS